MTPAAPFSHRRILVVDDNEAIHADFRKILAPCVTSATEIAARADALFDERSPRVTPSHFDIATASQGDEAIALVEASLRERRPFSVAFVDLRMPPGWDGVQTIGQLWKVDPDLQIVLCTAYSDYSWEQMTAALGETDRFVVLKKPFDTIEVQQLASALAEKWKQLRHARAHCDSLEKTAESRAADLRQSEERFRVLADHSHDLIAIMSPDGARIYTSPSYERRLGYSESRLRDAPACSLYHPDDQVAILLALQATAEAGATRSLECSMQHSDGTWRRFTAEFAAVREGYGAGNVLIVARDVTETRDTQDELQRTARELERACRFEPIRELVPGLAEELTAPARSIGDHAEFVQEGFRELRKLFTAQQQLIEALQSGRETTQLARAVEAAAHATDPQFLAQEIPRAIEETLQGVAQIARIADAMRECAPPEPDQRALIDLHTALESVITLAAHGWRRVAHIVTEFDRAVPPLSCRPADLKLAFLQLLLQCIRSVEAHPDARARIAISTRLDGDLVEVRMRTQGGRIPPDPTAALSAARATIAQLHAGSLRLDASDDHGSAFVVRLPLHRSARAGVAA